MEIRRYLNTRLWRDSWFESLNANEKFVYIYLLTNPSTNMLGIYNLSIRRIAYDCNLNEQTTRRCIKKLEEALKIIYCKGHIIIPDWISQNAMNPSMKQSAMKDFDKLPDEVRSELPPQLLSAIQKMRPRTAHAVPTLFTQTPSDTPEKEEEEYPEKKEEKAYEKNTIPEEKEKTEKGNGEKEYAPEAERKTSTTSPLPHRNCHEDIPQPLENTCAQAIESQTWLEALCMNHRIDIAQLHEWLEHFCRKLQNEGNLQKSVRDFRQHFANWLHIQLENQRKHPQHHENLATANRENSRQRKLDAIAALRTTVESDALQRLRELEIEGTLPPLPET